VFFLSLKQNSANLGESLISFIQPALHLTDVFQYPKSQSKGQYQPGLMTILDD
tara:strand:- start:528 stop:686 length:159 start_codon:yes stop_codon:yes gene_type:complete